MSDNAEASVGSVSVTVVPDAREWSAKLEPQILPQAKALGEQFGKAMADEIARQLGERTRNLPVGPGRPESARQGQQSAGAFADSFKAKMAAAMKSFPPIQIGAAATEAEQKLRDIRVELETLSRKTIGIDITDEEAVAKLTELRATLADLNQSAESIQVRADTAAALAHLDKLQAELDKLNHEDTDVDVRVDDHGSAAETEAKVAGINDAAGNSSGGVNLLGSKLLSLGALAVAASDIAIPALLAIGAAAGGLIAGVGVFALGMSGISEALQAHGQHNPGAAVSAQQQQLTARQATQAAADQLTSSLQSQKDAEVALARAQRDTTDAQKALTAARVQAKQDLQDLDNSVKDNALAQRQAALALAQARHTLALTLAAPGAALAQYAPQVAAAKLAVDQAQQHSAELALQGQRLATKDAVANKLGVEGSKLVVDAKRKIIDTNVALAKAHATLIAANHKVAESHQNVADTALKNALAQRQLAASTNQFGAAMAKLNPIQQQFVKFLLSMKPLFDDLKLAASGFLPGLERGIKDALPAFKPLLAIVSGVAQAMGGVFTQIGKGLASPDGQKFLKFLATELPKQIHFLGGLFIDFGKIFAGVWQAAGPLIDAVDKAVLGFFDSMAKSSNGNGLKAFFDSLIPLVKPLFEALSTLGQLFASLLSALAPALGPVLKVVAALALQLAKIAQPIIKPLAHAFADLLTALAPLLPMFGQMISQVLPPLARLFDALVQQGLVPLIDAFLQMDAKMLPSVIQAFVDLVNAVVPLVPPITEILLALVPLVPLMIQMTVGPLTAITPLIKDLTPAFKDLAKILTDILGPAIRVITTIFNDQNRIMKDVFTGMGGVVSASLKGLISIFHDISKPLTTAFNAVWGGIKTGWNDISSFFTKIVNGIIDVINDLIRILDKVKIKIPKVHIPGTSVNFGGGTIGFDIPTIPNIGGTSSIGSNNPYANQPGTAVPIHGARAAGGPVTAGAPYTVGEVGRELFIPKVDGRIIDNATTEKLLRSQGAVRNTVFNNYGVTNPRAIAQQAAAHMAARGV